VTGAVSCLFIAAALAVKAHRGWFHPATLCLSAWGVATALLALLPLGVVRLNGKAALILLAGVLSLAGGAIIGSGLKRPSAGLPGEGRRPTLATVVPVAGAIVLVLMVGLLRFRAQVTAATGAGSFSDLSATQVRFATVYGDAAKGGVGSLMMSVAPVLAALGIMATALSRWAWLLVGLALYATAQNPGRTFTLTVVATAAAFFAYLWPRRQVQLPWSGTWSRKRLVAMLNTKVSGLYQHAEKVVYDSTITGGVIVNGLNGDDAFAFDDNSSTMVVNGGAGRDIFRIGQLYTGYQPDPLFGIDEGDFAHTTRGWLTNGVTFNALYTLLPEYWSFTK